MTQGGVLILNLVIAITIVIGTIVVLSREAGGRVSTFNKIITVSNSLAFPHLFESL